MTDTGFTFTQTVPINSTIPKVKVKFAANHLVYDRPDQLAVIVAKIELVAASPVYDDTFATVYGFPIEQTAANVNTVVTFPLQATTDSLGSGRYLKQVNGSPVEYKLTVTGRELGSETDIILVPGLKFHVDAEDTDNTFIIALAAAQDRPFLPSLTAAAKQQVATYIDQLIGLGAIVYDDGPLTARVTQAEADIAAIEVAEVAGIVFSPTLDNNVGDDGEYQRTADGNVYGPRSGGVYPGTPVATGGAGYDDTALDARVTQNESDIATNTADIASIVTGGLPFLVGPDPTGGDDATALQAFFDTFPATGANAFLPGGVYKTSVGLQIDSHNVTLWGAGPGQEDGATHDAQGTRIEAIGTLAGTPMLLVQDPGNTEPLHGVEIRNIALDGMGTATGAGLYYRSYRGIVSNVKIYRFAGKGFHAHGYPAWDLYESKLFNVEVSDSGWGLFWDDGATDMHVNHCVLYDNNIGWELFDGGSVQAVACHIYNSTVDNLFFNGAGSRSKFSGFKIEGAGRNGVNMDSTLGGSSDVQFANCNITSNTDTSTINTEDSFVIQGPSGNGITRVTISGCNFSTKSATQANNPRHFIYLATCAQQTVIVGNNFGPASHYGTSPIGGTGTALASATITGNGGSNIDNQTATDQTATDLAAMDAASIASDGYTAGKQFITTDNRLFMINKGLDRVLELDNGDVVIDPQKRGQIVGSNGVGTEVDPQFASFTAQKTHNTTGFNDVFEEASVYGLSDFGDGRKCRVLIRPGKYRTNGTVGLTKTVDGNVGVQIVGGNSATTQIWLDDTTIPVANFSTTVGNMRELEMTGLMLRGGSIGLQMNQAKYNLFRDIRFFQNELWAHHITQGGLNYFDHMRYVECFGNSVFALAGENDFWNAPKIGEGAGGWHLDGAQHTIDNPQAHDAFDRLNLTNTARESPSPGRASMGEALFTVYGAGTLQVNGGYIDVFRNLCNTQNAVHVGFNGTRLRWDSEGARTGYLVTQDDWAKSGTIDMKGRITVRQAASVVDLIRTRVEGQLLRGTTIDMDINSVAGATVNADTDMVIPGRRNHMNIRLNQEATF